MTDYSSFPTLTAINAADPTRTLTLRSKFVREWNARMARLTTAVMTSVVTNDALGLEQLNAQPRVQADDGPKIIPGKPGEWTYRWSQDRIKAFLQWLDEAVNKSLLEVVVRPGTNRPGGEPWSDYYIRSAYQSGLQRTMAEVKRRSNTLAQQLGLAESAFMPAFTSTGKAVSALMMQPFHADRLALMYTRTFEELKGITTDMSKQMAQILTKGMAQGLNPREMGKALAEKVPGIAESGALRKAQVRGQLIARTEVIHTHAQATLNEFYALEEASDTVFLVRWLATKDTRTRPAHARLVDPHEGYDGLVMTKEEAYGRVGRPNCRCCLVPYIPEVEGMPEKVTDAAREICEQVLKDKGE